MKRVILLTVIIGGLGLFAAQAGWPFLKGLLFGALFTLLRIRLMYISFHKAVHKSEKQVQAYMMLQYGIRYGLTAFILIIAIKEPSLNILGTIIGILLLKPAVLFDVFSKTVKE